MGFISDFMAHRRGPAVHSSYFCPSVCLSLASVALKRLDRWTTQIVEQLLLNDSLQTLGFQTPKISVKFQLDHLQHLCQTNADLETLAIFDRVSEIINTKTYTYAYHG